MTIQTMTTLTTTLRTMTIQTIISGINYRFSPVYDPGSYRRQSGNLQLVPWACFVLPHPFQIAPHDGTKAIQYIEDQL